MVDGGTEMTRTRITALAALTLTALGAFAAPGPIVIGALKGPSGIGMIKLFEEPPVPADGSIVKPIAVASVDLMTAKLISGEYDAGVLPINVAAKLSASGIPVRLAAVVGEGMLSFLSADESIRGLADLRGKRVFVAGQGATPDYLFRRLLRGVGLDPAADLRLDYSLPYPEAAAALASGEITYAILPEPFSTMARRRNPRLEERLDLGALWKEQTGQAVYPMTCLVVSSALATRRPAAVRAILDAYASSIIWIAAHPAEAGALVEKHELGLKADVAAASIPRSAQVFKDARTARPEIEALLGVFLELAPASVGGKLPDDGFYASF
jgi:NitT/TauT family transport system substrate-binding protein